MKTELINGTRIKCYAQPDKPGHFDRFTVVYPDEKYSNDPRLVPCAGLSGHGGAMIGRHLGKRVPFASLPEQLKRTVEMDTAVAMCETGSLAIA